MPNKKIILMTMAIMTLITIALLWPSSELRTEDMKLYVSDNFAVYFEPQDEQAAIDIIKKLEDRLPEIHNLLQFEKSGQTEIYLYHDQSLFQSRKYGRLASWMAPQWYVGDVIRDKVIMMSPSADGLVHSYDEMLKVAVHEYIHTVNHRINSGMSLWLDEGLALYLSGQSQLMINTERQVPAFKEITTNNPLKFARIGGYEFAGSYVEYISHNFGQHKLADLVRHPDRYSDILGFSQEELYHLWAAHLMDLLILPEEFVV